MMTSPGCLDNDDPVEPDLSDGTEVTLEIYHGSSFEDAEAYYTVVITLYDELVPLHADNFKTHAMEGNFDNVTFHRVIDNFMIQGGDFQNHDGTADMLQIGMVIVMVKKQINQNVRHRKVGQSL
jgi:hypothetical protein